MANVTKKPVWKVDTVGMVYDKPLRIKFIQLYPNTAGDAFELDYWDETAAVATSKIAVTATTSTGTFTQSGGSDLSSTNFPQYDVMKIAASTGDQANLGYYWIATTGGTGNTVITVAPNFTTNEATKNYSLTAYGVGVAFAGICQATTKVDDYYFFGDRGLYLPNLVLKSISSNAVLYVGVVADF
jgi:hypothetical protein